MSAARCAGATRPPAASTPTCRRRSQTATTRSGSLMATALARWTASAPRKAWLLASWPACCSTAGVSSTGRVAAQNSSRAASSALLRSLAASPRFVRHAAMLLQDDRLIDIMIDNISQLGLRRPQVGVQQPHEYGTRWGKGHGPAGSVIASAVLLSQRPQHHRSIRWQAGCGAQGRQARAPQPARQLLFPPQPADTASDEPPADRKPELATDREAGSAYLDFLMVAVTRPGRRGAYRGYRQDSGSLPTPSRAQRSAIPVTRHGLPGLPDLRRPP